MLEDAAEELRSGIEERPAAEREPVRVEVEVDAYVPAEYVPFEAAKIDLHRRVAAARDRGELRALREELEDRFGPVPEPVANLMELQRVRIELGAAGARSVEFRAGRLRVSPLELDSEAAAEVRERVEGAIYEWRDRTLAPPVPDEPAARLAALAKLAEALTAVGATDHPEPAPDPAALARD
jgi:transcription-repair coupling factor (superfamily II helicase)